MNTVPLRFGFEALGTRWSVSVWDTLSAADQANLERDTRRICEDFEATYSRFRPHSLVRELSTKTGTFAVPRDLVTMLRLYEDLWRRSGGAFSPLVGRTLESLGYDPEYSLTSKDIIAPVPALPDVIRIIDDEHLELTAEALLDLGGIGKGFCVDRIADDFRRRGFKRFLVDGSGDIFYAGDGHPIRCGLEHPDDPSKVIGLLELTDGSLCASGSNRRRWEKVHHIVDPRTLASPEGILGTWVFADSATCADALATCLFLAEPEAFDGFCRFEYCVLNAAYAVKRSPGFTAELFS